MRGGKPAHFGPVCSDPMISSVGNASPDSTLQGEHMCSFHPPPFRHVRSHLSLQRGNPHNHDGVPAAAAFPSHSLLASRSPEYTAATSQDVDCGRSPATGSSGGKERMKIVRGVQVERFGRWILPLILYMGGFILGPFIFFFVFPLSRSVAFHLVCSVSNPFLLCSTLHFWPSDVLLGIVEPIPQIYQGTARTESSSGERKGSSSTSLLSIPHD